MNLKKKKKKKKMEELLNSKRVKIYPTKKLNRVFLFYFSCFL